MGGLISGAVRRGSLGTFHSTTFYLLYINMGETVTGDLDVAYLTT